jgi:hypothetical protein
VEQPSDQQGGFARTGAGLNPVVAAQVALRKLAFAGIDKQLTITGAQLLFPAFISILIKILLQF